MDLTAWGLSTFENELLAENPSVLAFDEAVVDRYRELWLTFADRGVVLVKTGCEFIEEID